MAAKSTPPKLLTQRDPPVVTLLNAQSEHPVLLVCEHAGQMIPERLSGLGLGPDALDRHIGWDIGAVAVTRLLADVLGAPAVLQNYSRLVIDCNRPPAAGDSIPEISDDTLVPGNRWLAPEWRAARIGEIFDPFQAAVAKSLSHPARQAVFAIHSFTPVFAGVVRPWDVAFLYRGDPVTPAELRKALLAQNPKLKIGMNEPYQIENASDWFVPVHAEPSGLPHSLIEIRNDLINASKGQLLWANLLHDAIEEFLEGYQL